MKKIFLFTYLFFITLIAFGRVLPKEVIWNDDESGYYAVKENNIVLVSTKGEKDKIILSSNTIGKIEI